MIDIREIHPPKPEFRAFCRDCGGSFHSRDLFAVMSGEQSFTFICRSCLADNDYTIHMGPDDDE